MENVFFKYGMILIGGVVIMLLVTFTFSALRTIRTSDDERSLKGEKANVVIGIIELCNFCTKDAYNRDCYIKDVEIDRPITQTDIGGETVFTEDLPAGASVIKIKSINETCMVVRLA